MQRAIWRTINPRNQESITNGNDFYQQIYDFRKGIHTIRTDSLASLRYVNLQNKNI